MFGLEIQFTSESPTTLPIDIIIVLYQNYASVETYNIIINSPTWFRILSLNTFFQGNYAKESEAVAAAALI